VRVPSEIRYKKNFDTTLNYTRFSFSWSSEAGFKDLSEQTVISRNMLVNLSTWYSLHAILKADLHTACRAHAAPMLFTCHAVTLRV
jgi:hypothetical protein